MPVTPSPLRYPGGKTALATRTEQILRSSGLAKATYSEPFAGGAGLALSLLYNGVVRRLALNDIDPGIYSFWNAVLNDTDRLVQLVDSTPVTMSEWYRQRDFQREHDAPSLELGFATFFLNRTNRSGIIKGGVIGGYQQAGDYMLDCRYNVEELVAKIRRIARYKKSIEFSNLDAELFLRRTDDRGERLVFFIDPPYFSKGSGLYTNFYKKKDHENLSRTVRSLTHPWILTYDLVPDIQNLYVGFEQQSFDLNYTASVKRVGTELMVTSPGISTGGTSTALAKVV